MMTSLLYDFTIVSRSGNSDQSDSSNLTFKTFPGGACPRTPLGGCASGARVRLRRTFRNSFDKGPMQHSDPGPKNSLRGPEGENYVWVLAIIGNLGGIHKRITNNSYFATECNFRVKCDTLVFG